MSGDRTTPRQFDIVASTRRQWGAEQKRAMVNEIAAGSSVSEVARRHGVHTSQLFRWRRELRAELSNGAPAATPEFVPIRLPAPAATSTAGKVGSIEITIAGGRRVRVDLDVDTAALVRVITALEEGR